VFATIVIIWIILAGYLIAMDFLSTGVVGSICIPWGAFRSYQELKTIAAYSMTYVLPVTLMVFCYSRIVYVLKHKVILM